ncbi:GlxA family transcriptional regulator [Aromatoleum toluolicum]|uniref:GlxA family transcriptional regulator n=1 Tax=Aromatoleum toluolicum TaxID=90060 RepID=UPI001B7D0F35|nr:GlxA family transcriptional regulator [Aromatoleum toluolicum]NMF96916.2 GlxA family transcriptional regulator [Aromatoleum toluolicum]
MQIGDGHPADKLTVPFKSLLKHRNRPHVHERPWANPSSGCRRVIFVVLDHFSLMAFTGAVDALATANLVSREPLFEALVLSADGEMAVTDVGIGISVDGDLSALQVRRGDLVIVCGGLRVRLQTPPQLRAQLLSAHAAGATLGALWNGAFFLADAGLLDDHECTVHPDTRALMSEKFPRTRVSRCSYVLDGPRMSCAGANSSLGMMLAWLRRDYEPAVVDSVEEILSCDKSQEVVAAPSDRDPTLPQALKLALELMHSNIDEPLAIEEIAELSDLSRRQLDRLFNRYLGASPSRYYLELRVTHARQLLQHSNEPIAEIAVAAGFASISHFCQCFRQFFNVAPGKFRLQQLARS